MGVFDGFHYLKAQELPPVLADAVQDVGRALGLSDRWLNNGPASLMDFGLPVGFEERVVVRNYGALEVHIPSREDHICFKLYAAVDQGPQSKHFRDLFDLQPSVDELRFAAKWTITHDPSKGFLSELNQALAELDVEVTDAFWADQED